MHAAVEQALIKVQHCQRCAIIIRVLCGGFISNVIIFFHLKLMMCEIVREWQT